MMRYVLLLMLFVPVALLAQGQATVTEDPLDARVRALSMELRCLTCQGQSVADSHSDFSRDVQRKMRELMAQGMTDDQVREFFKERYGDYILYRPPFKPATALLWLGPFLLLFIAASVLAYTIMKRRQRGDVPALSAEEQARVQAMLGKSEAGENK